MSCVSACLNQEKCATQEFKKVKLQTRHSFEIESSESSQFTLLGLTVVRPSIHPYPSDPSIHLHGEMMRCDLRLQLDQP